VITCLEPGADLHLAQLMPLPLTVSCFSKIQIGSIFLIPAHLGSPGKGPLNGCVYVCVCVCVLVSVVQVDEPMVIPACRSMCVEVRRRCEPVLLRFLYITPFCANKQEVQLSPRDRAMRRVC